MLNVKPIMWEGREAKMAILTDVTHHKALEAELLTAHGQMEERIRKRTTELSEANTQLKAEAEERSKAQERILTLTQQIIRVQEDERQRIARDLHDNVAQDLSSLMLRMETLFDGHSRVDQELHKRGLSVMEVLRGAIASVRDIAYGLRPPALDQLGLVKALENLCTEAGNRHSFDVDFFSTGIQDIALDFDTEINIYRMVQEAVRNIARHARAKTATIRLVKSHPDILIRIEDNGRGFLVQERLTTSDSEKRMGLRSMEERARLIGGAMEIQSLPGTGTRIIFKVPIDSARRQD
jgi:signal transduction histidine kinase